MTCEAVFKEVDGDSVQCHIPLGLEILANGCHQPQADMAVSVLGGNLPKVVSTMADNAAADVGEKIFAVKEEAIATLMGGEVNFTEQQLEIMTTNFVDTCITHGGDLASKKHFTETCAAMTSVIVHYNAATIIQGAAGRKLIRLRLMRKELTHTGPNGAKMLQPLLAKMMCGRLGPVAWHTPMKLGLKANDDGSKTKEWQLTGEFENVWSLMCSMSNLISHQGKHADYYLNESKAFRLFWAKWAIENEVHGDTELTDLPSFAHNRFGIRQELSFKLCVTWIAAMTYVSEVRIRNPDYDANLLLQNTYKLNDRIYRAFVVSSAVMHGSICQLMRYCWHTEGFCDPYQRDETIEVYERCVMGLPKLDTASLTSALAELKIVFGPEKGAQLQRFWDNDQHERDIVFKQAQDPEFKSYVEMFLQQAAEPTKNDIASRKRVVPEASCLKHAPIHNMTAENLFAHQSYAEQSTRAQHNRLRGLGLSKASSTFALRGKLRSNRKKRFLAMVKRSKAELSEWKEKHKDDDGFLNLFNEKFISVEKRHKIILEAISGRRCNVTPPLSPTHTPPPPPQTAPLLPTSLTFLCPIPIPLAEK